MSLAEMVQQETKKKLKSLLPVQATYNRALALALVLAAIDKVAPNKTQQFKLRAFSREAWKSKNFNPESALYAVTRICDIENNEEAIEVMLARAYTICAEAQPCDHWDVVVGMVRYDQVPAIDILRTL